MTCRTCCKTFSLIVVLLALAILATPAFAQTCLKDEYGKNVQCTANDVRVAFADNPRGLDGKPLTSCTAGSTFSFVADFHVVTTATARENIGLYFQTAGGANALTGTCSDNIISPKHTAVNPADSVQLGSSDYFSNDASPDTCGDITTAHNNQTVTVEVDNAKCVAGANGLLALPDCTSWQQPGGTIQCVSNAPSYPWVKAAIPGSPSKCNCDNGFTVPIQVQSPNVTVAKACTTAISTGLNTSCDAGQEGSDVTYTVTVTNTSNFGNIVVDQICDTAYGNIFTAATFGGSACASGSAGAKKSTDCDALGSIAAGTSGSCTFVATQGESATVKNTVSVSGHGSSAGSFGPSASNQVSVTSTDAPSTATTTKSNNGTTNACFTVHYGVDVANTSGADESITLTALSDNSFGDITTVHGNVLATTCSLGTGVTLPVGGGASSKYSCTFDATFCGAPTTVTKPDQTTCTGVQHTNTVTPTLIGDDTPPETVTNSGGALTVTECISSF